MSVMEIAPVVGAKERGFANLKPGAFNELERSEKALLWK